MSTLKADTIQSTSGGAATLTKQSATKVWLNLNGTGTIATRDSFNVSGVVDNGTGNYTTSFTSSFDDANYSHAHTTYLKTTSFRRLTTQTFHSYRVLYSKETDTGLVFQV